MNRIVAHAQGIFSHVEALKDTCGVGTLPIQVALPFGSSATYRILGRVSPEAPWVELRAASSEGILEAMLFCPHVAIDIIAISGGPLVCWVGDA